MKATLSIAVLFLLTIVSAFAQDRGYLIQREDVLRIQVYGEQQINVEVPVGRDGNISAPFVGTIRAEGRTTAELEAELTTLYGERLKLRNPKVGVGIVTIRPIRASVNGAVNRPGTYEVRPGDTLLVLLSQAGDVIQQNGLGADLRHATLHRKGTDEVIPIDLYAMKIRMDLSQNYEVQDGDQLIIPDDRTNHINVMGWVQRPGQYPYREPMTLADAMSISGGEIPNRSMLSQTRIMRPRPGAPGEYIQIVSNFTRWTSLGDYTQNVELQPGDFIYVPQTKTPDFNLITNALNSLFFINQLATNGFFGIRPFKF